MQDPDTESGFWAVIYLNGGKRIIGRFEVPNCGDDTLAEEVLATSVDKGECFHILDAFEFISSLMPMQGPRGQTAMTRVTQCMPMDAGLYPAELHTRIEGFRLFGSMQEDDRNEHKNLVRQVIEQTRANRMQRAGIVPGSLAPTGNAELRSLIENLKGKQ